METREPSRGVYAQLDEDHWQWVQERSNKEDRSVASIVRQGIRLLRRLEENMPSVSFPATVQDD